MKSDVVENPLESNYVDHTKNNKKHTNGISLRRGQLLCLHDTNLAKPEVVKVALHTQT